MIENYEQLWPQKISNPARRALVNAGFTSLRQLTSITEKELLALHGMGPKAIRILKEELANARLTYKEEAN